MSKGAFDIGYVGATKSIFSQIPSTLNGSSPNSCGASQSLIMVTTTCWDSGDSGGSGGTSPRPCTPSSVWTLTMTNSKLPALSCP
jgi:hypothetical protein